MKIKQPIYLVAALAGLIALIAGPSIIGTEYGLALGFILLFFGLYGISRRVSNAEDTDSSGTEDTDASEKSPGKGPQPSDNA